jgi:hypothetical protein
MKPSSCFPRDFIYNYKPVSTNLCSALSLLFKSPELKHSNGINKFNDNNLYLSFVQIFAGYFLPAFLHSSP